MDRIDLYTIQGRADFLADFKTQDAVIRNLETLGDATRQLPEAWKASQPQVPWRKVADFRNVLAHQYLEVNLEIVWKIIETELPGLREATAAIVAEFCSDQS